MAMFGMILPWHRCHSFGWVVAAKATGEIVVRYLSNGAIFSAFGSVRSKTISSDVLRSFCNSLAWTMPLTRRHLGNLPSGKLAMEHHHFQSVNPLEITIFQFANY